MFSATTYVPGVVVDCGFALEANFQAELADTNSPQYEDLVNDIKTPVEEGFRIVYQDGFLGTHGFEFR